MRRLAQRRHHGTVGRRHGIGAEFFQRRPRQRLLLQPLGLAAETRDAKYLKHDALVTIGLRHGDQRVHRVDADTEFFVQFAVERLERRLARLDLAAREFPGAGQVTARGAAGQEDSAAGVGEDARDHMDQTSWPWHCLYFLPEPHGHGSLRPTFWPLRTEVVAANVGVAPRTSAASSSAP